MTKKSGGARRFRVFRVFRGLITPEFPAIATVLDPRFAS